MNIDHQQTMYKFLPLNSHVIQRSPKIAGGQLRMFTPKKKEAKK